MSRLERLHRRTGIDPRAPIGLAVLAAGTMIWVLAFTGVIPKLFSARTHAIRANFASTEDIVPNDPVRIDGVQVGTVGRVTLDKGARGATLTLNLDSSAGTIYRNARASILWRTALGANDAVALDPGTAGAGLLGSAPIPQSHDRNQVELDEITRTLHAGAQTGLQTMLKQLGPAFSDRLAPEATFRALAQAAPVVAVGVGAVRGQVPDTDLRNLVTQAAHAAQALDVGAHAGDTRQFVESAARTLVITATEQRDISQILQDAVVALPHVTTTAFRVDHALGLLDPLVAKLAVAAPRVAPTLDRLRPTLTDASTLLDDAVPLLHSLHPTVESLHSTAVQGIPVIDGLSPSLRQIGDQILISLERVSPETKHTVYEMVGPALAGIDGVAAQYSTTHLARLDLGVQENAIDNGACNVNFTNIKHVLVCQSLQALINQQFDPSQNLVSAAVARMSGESPKLTAALLKAIPGLARAAKSK